MKKSFTLFEIMIVLIIILVVYGVVFTTLSHKKHNLVSIKPDMIKDFLSKQDFQNNIELVCLKDYKCIVYIDNNISNISFQSLFKNDIEVYQFKKNRFEEIDFKDMEINDKNYEVTLRLKIYKPHNNKELVIKYKNDKLLYIHPYFTIIKTFSSISDIEEYIMDNQRLVDAL